MAAGVAVDGALRVAEVACAAGVERPVAEFAEAIEWPKWPKAAAGRSPSPKTLPPAPRWRWHCRRGPGRPSRSARRGRRRRDGRGLPLGAARRRQRRCAAGRRSATGRAPVDAAGAVANAAGVPLGSTVATPEPTAVVTGMSRLLRRRRRRPWPRRAGGVRRVARANRPHHEDAGNERAQHDGAGAQAPFQAPPVAGCFAPPLVKCPWLGGGVIDAIEPRRWGTVLAGGMFAVKDPGHACPCLAGTFRNPQFRTAGAGPSSRGKTPPKRWLHRVARKLREHQVSGIAWPHPI